MAHGCMLQSEEEGLKVKQEETGETVQLPDQAGRAAAEAGTSLVVPVQNGEGDSLNLSAGFIQVHILLKTGLLMAMEATLLLLSSLSVFIIIIIITGKIDGYMSSWAGICMCSGLFSYRTTPVCLLSYIFMSCGMLMSSQA